MNRSEFKLLIEDVLEEDPGTVDVTAPLTDYGWDSMTFMSFIAKVDSELGLTLSPAKISLCNTSQELIELVSEHLEG